MHSMTTLAGLAAMILALVLIGLSVWTSRSRQRNDTEGEAPPAPEDGEMEEEHDPADPRRKFSTRDD